MNAGAASALGRIGAERAVEPLIAVLQDQDQDEDWWVRCPFVNALKMIGTPDALAAAKEYREESEDE